MTSTSPLGDADAYYRSHPSPPVDLESLRAEVYRDPIATAAYQDSARHREVLEAMSQARKRAGLSQSATAALMGTTQSAISSLESGRIDPQLSTMQRYARATGQRFDFVFVDDSVPRYDETVTEVMWSALEAQALGPLLKRICTGAEDQRSLRALASAVGLPIPIIESMLSSLAARGWIAMAGGDTVDPYFSLSKGAGYFIGISVEREQIVGSLIDIHTEAVGVTRTRSLSGTRTDVVVDAILDITAQLCYDSPESRICGVGVTIAGVVETSTGTVRFATALHSDRSPWAEVALESLLQAELSRRVDSQLKIVVTEQSNALAMREHLRNGPQSVVAVSIIGDGITLGLVVNGQTVYGVHGAAGEGGHVIVDPDGPLCRANFPHHGCLETVASASAILERLGHPTSSVLDVEEGLLLVNDRVERGDQDAIAVLRDAGRLLGGFLAASTTLMDPQRLTLFAHPQLADRTRYRSAEIYQDGVDAGFLTCRGLVEPVDKGWSAINPRTLVTSAGATAIDCFFHNPTAWNPALLGCSSAGKVNSPKDDLLFSR